MEMITLPPLRNKELQTFTVEAKKISKIVSLLAPSIQKVEDAETLFVEAMLKDKSTNVSKRDLDRTRDSYFSGMLQAIKSERIFPIAEVDKKNALDAVWNIILKHGTDIARLPYNEETAALDNLFIDINALESLSLVSEGITKWFPVVQAANDTFKVASEEFISESALISDTDSATKVAPLLREALQDLLIDLFSYTRVEKTDELKTAYAKMSALVNSYH